MAINLNHLQYGAQFKAFTDFAAGQRNQDTIVRLEGPGQGLPGPNGEPRVILAKQGDGYGHVWRNDDSKAINNNVRDLFLRSILAVCGVARIDQLPENVQAVMKADDYRGGHPLTARRITAVKNAIDASIQAEANTAKSMIEAQLARTMSAVPAATRSQKAQQLVELAKGDVDLLYMLADDRHNRLAANIQLQGLQRQRGAEKARRPERHESISEPASAARQRLCVQRHGGNIRRFRDHCELTLDEKPCKIVQKTCCRSTVAFAASRFTRLSRGLSPTGLMLQWRCLVISGRYNERGASAQFWPQGD